ncbi:dihydrofolate reductase family protein [Candidatus Saccharibacteria bacterium]|nr:dihydrofolate reductase family protein [Candidatus Saccharibacteria bacterium]MBP9131932.1 dihydrofolate reductase family protein [Candidatus Saccharibacteria bacterium]
MKLTVYMAQSLNGLIATKNDDTPWSDDSWESYEKIISKFEAIIIGRKTFESIQQDPNEWDNIGNPLVIILSDSLSVTDTNFASVRSPEDAVEILKQKNIKKAAVCGGAHLNTTFLDKGMISEMIIDIESQLLVSGINFINEKYLSKNIKLELMQAKKISKNLAQLTYVLKIKNI